MKTTLQIGTEEHLEKLQVLLDMEKFSDASHGMSVDDQMPFVITNLIRTFHERLTEIEEKLGISE